MTLRNLFTSVCSMLTILLICQELDTFVNIKPTSTSKEELELVGADIPETVLCANPGFSSDVLQRYGYASNTYYRGSMDTEKFVGWNGGKNENKSSRSILEEALLELGVEEVAVFMRLPAVIV